MPKNNTREHDDNTERVLDVFLCIQMTLSQTVGLLFFANLLLISVLIFGCI